MTDTSEQIAVDTTLRAIAIIYPLVTIRVRDA
jgi:hypothetical protein